MTRVGLEDARSKLPELLDRAAGGEEILIVENDKLLGMVSGPPVQDGHDFPEVGTPEWDVMNRRRIELIKRKAYGKLTQAEKEELEHLQRGSLEAVNRAHPGPTPDIEGLKRLREELAAKYGSSEG